MDKQEIYKEKVCQYGGYQLEVRKERSIGGWIQHTLKLKDGDTVLYYGFLHDDVTIDDCIKSLKERVDVLNHVKRGNIV